MATRKIAASVPAAVYAPVRTMSRVVPAVMPANTNHLPPATDTGASDAELTDFVENLARLAAQMYREGRLNDPGAGQQ